LLPVLLEAIKSEAKITLINITILVLCCITLIVLDIILLSGVSMGRNWAVYNEALVRRGEILLDLSILKGWGMELKRMNMGKEGSRYRYPWSFIKLLGFIHTYFRLPYRQLEGFTRALTKWEPRLKVADYTTICRRVNSLDMDLDPNIDREQDLVIALDASGIKVTNRGEWMRRKWKARRGYLKVHLAVDVRSKQILSMKVTDEKVGDGRVLKPLVKKAQKHGEVKRALADGGYDSKENFNFLAEEGIDPAIKVRKNSSKKARGCWARKIVVTQYLRNPEGWKKKVGYGLRWMAETAFSTIKRLFGEHVTSRKFPNMVKEMLLKAALYNLFTNLNP